mmetsp:Transcript_9958/g.17937  ORF Transcript_9958/g.17937 Transcript_9958/m.17937 type:complete len:200 (-) Transcript_9958:264-863(-)|eukprot:CAMPEP_0182450712 /NCGR_PEP_ID=MMETSP1172-20130603/43119_1 /TAXON_ID=708627 /ORGANISM="Timspurckia oligopyrenoides, Strain CCMP3278" /LENGTH=199 /DNA_ID=CAMNT_0024648413 /DNA_START=225 /DNA_END=824 /DNA_ORIENTATION=+
MEDELIDESDVIAADHKSGSAQNVINSDDEDDLFFTPPTSPREQRGETSNNEKSGLNAEAIASNVKQNEYISAKKIAYDEKIEISPVVIMNKTAVSEMNKQSNDERIEVIAERKVEHEMENRICKSCEKLKKEKKRIEARYNALRDMMVQEGRKAEISEVEEISALRTTIQFLFEQLEQSENEKKKLQIKLNQFQKPNS